MVMYEEIGAPASQGCDERGSAVDDEFLGVSEVFTPIVELDYENSVVSFLARQQAEPFPAPPVPGELSVTGRLVWQVVEFHWLPHRGWFVAPVGS